jgi:PLP dependent protein
MASAVAALRENVERVRATIAEAALRAGRAPESVRLVGVSKTHPPELVAEAARLGVLDFGENRVQEGQAKIPRVAELLGPSLGRVPTWHMIGALQRNKVRACLEHFDLIQSVDSLKLARAISDRAEGRAVGVLLEVYVGDDPERPGFRPDVLLEDAGSVLALPGLDVRGLMTVAPLGTAGEAARAAFRQVRELRDRLRKRHPDARLDELSMGMTDDYPLAIAEGATIVRVGRAIFGARPPA